MATLIYHPRGMFQWLDSAKRNGPFDIVYAPEEIETLTGEIETDVFERASLPFRCIPREKIAGKLATRFAPDRRDNRLSSLIELIEPLSYHDRTRGYEAEVARLMTTLAASIRRKRLEEKCSRKSRRPKR